MQTVEVTAERRNGTPVTVSFDIAETLTELVTQFGEEIVFGHGKRSIVIALQGYMRSLMDAGKEAGKSDSEIATAITEAVANWKPSQKKAPKTTQEKARDILGRLSPAERQALLKEYRASKGGGDAQASV